MLTMAIPGNGSVAIPYVVRSMIGYHSNSWAFCIYFTHTVELYRRMDGDKPW